MPNARVAAAAGGLPTRRATLATLAGLGATLALPKPARAAAHPDATLLELYRQWRASADECDRLNPLLWAAEESMVFPDTPQALFRREDDTTHLSGLKGWEHHSGVYWYGDPDSIQRLRSMECQSFDGMRWRPNKPAAARRDEILRAHDSWQAEIDAAADACGLTVISKQNDEAEGRNRELRRAIVETPAATVEGALLKLQVAIWCNPDVAREMLDFNLREHGTTDVTLVWAAVADLARIGSHKALANISIVDNAPTPASKSAVASEHRVG